MRRVLCMSVVLVASGGAGCASRFDRAIDAVGRNEAIVLQGETGGRVLVSARHQGRVMTSSVGAVDSVGFVCEGELREGEVHPNFNNFGGQDRLWLGPEAGQFGIYFEPGSELRRDLWRVPKDFNEGAFQVDEKSGTRVVMNQEIAVTNYSGTKFKTRVRREVGIVPESSLTKSLGVALPAGVSYTGCTTDNTLTNIGEAAWTPEGGLLNIWVLGMFNPGARTVILIPLKEGDGPDYRDEPYFGKIPEERLKRIGSTLLFRADARAEGKIGVPPGRSSGIAGSYDFAQDLLIVVTYDVPKNKALFGNSTWEKVQSDPYGGDLFQAYNANAPGGTPPGRYAFYELESVSPSVALKPEDSVRHRQTTHCFQGDRKGLAILALALFKVDLAEVERTFFAR